MCTESGTTAIQGSFSVGYKSTFETIGTDVIVTFEMLDTDKSSGNAYLWQESPFAESQMDFVSTNVFTKTLSGLSNGTTLSYACKFEFAGGLAVTEYVSYVVGSDCSGGSDTEAPTNFTASIGNITSTSIELLLNADDNSGTVVYDASYSLGNKNTTGASGIEESLVVSALGPNTLYTFTITASDLIGNNASNNPIVLQATTLENTNTECSGIDSEAQQGVFDVGYNYSFSTSGTDVTFTFELLDNKDGVIAYLWKQSPFTETPMSNVSGKIFTHTISGQTPGATINYACKFAFAGGLAVTKYFSYQVGNACSLNIDDFENENKVQVFPNPTRDNWTFHSKNQNISSIKIYNILGKQVLSISPNSNEIDINASKLKQGLYFAQIKSDTNNLQTVKLLKN